ncbi:MAG: NAD(P)H-hydrate dehydratase [Immundisolibacteraceae bacterium]|nr:NAD(P)H-hydrate dehydratase [Immundisolibacteraceae bacterium]
MQVLYKDLYTTEQSRMLDKNAIENYGQAGCTLMENAGIAVFNHYRRRWPLARRILVLAGPGNNGGDGYVVAAQAASAGHQVTLVAFGEPATDSDANRFRQEWLTAGHYITHPAEINAPDDSIAGHDLVVDALLGTGLSRSPDALMAEWIEAVNNSRVATVAVDVPSGLDSDVGVVLGTAIRAQTTVTFIGRKQGLYTGQGPEYCGKVQFVGLDVSREVYGEVDAAARLAIANGDQRPMIPPRSRTSHKGDQGHLLLIAGGPGMAGAAIIAGSAALRAGSGLVSVVVHPDNAAAVVHARPEMMVHGIADPADLEPLLERADVVAIGPGLGRGPWAQQIWAIIAGFSGPLIVDADALNLLVQAPHAAPNRVLTPHVGEAARLLGCGVSEIEGNRFAAVKALLKKYSGTVLLKGAGTLVQTARAVPTVIRGGNPGMASGGMGDALTGVVGAFLAQGLDRLNATLLGAAAHAWAGDLAAAQIGERGLLATDLIARLPQVINGRHGQLEPGKYGSVSGKFGR